ncbi:hypothetical protein EIN_284430 [Entamoeba invadens IP1]|uniref:Uncharacterized protein n=1 Tax=Entamoeba invadens IP1 TaxID=370355 RepID=L7FKD9_ENTIV|nr:hypothetical protein EIN_284430 [Entamoeba invadens IP1]ELP84867.1 hypothetical protein EIN_284430 [Entamoeba invadens IP1]|eukprot:XP_004184213.1 hypothetical protein EIN_284430 [Entamoeba invadens IP1]
MTELEKKELYIQVLKEEYDSRLRFYKTQLDAANDKIQHLEHPVVFKDIKRDLLGSKAFCDLLALNGLKFEDVENYKLTNESVDLKELREQLKARGITSEI